MTNATMNEPAENPPHPGSDKGERYTTIDAVNAKLKQAGQPELKVAFTLGEADALVKEGNVFTSEAAGRIAARLTVGNHTDWPYWHANPDDAIKPVVTHEKLQSSDARRYKLAGPRDMQVEAINTAFVAVGKERARQIEATANEGVKNKEQLEKLSSDIEETLNIVASVRDNSLLLREAVDGNAMMTVGQKWGVDDILHQLDSAALKVPADMKAYNNEVGRESLLKKIDAIRKEVDETYKTDRENQAKEPAGMAAGAGALPVAEVAAATPPLRTPAAPVLPVRGKPSYLA